jgi:hypothetical protein
VRTDRGSSRAGTAAGVVVLLAIAGALLYGAWRFLLVVRDGRSPGVLAWVAIGLLLFAVGAVIGYGIAQVFHADEDRAGAVGAITALVVVAAGLGTAYYWAEVREPALVKALGAACRGHGVAAAPAPTGARRVVVLDRRGHKIDWTTRDASWRAGQVAEADLVACVSRTEEVLETCTYRPVTGGPSHSIDRFEEVLTVRIVAAHTADPLGQFELRGSPRACKKVEKESQGDLHGHVALGALTEALAPYLG